MRKVLKWLNGYFWKHYGFALRIVHHANKFVPIEGKMYFVYLGLSDVGYKVVYRDGNYKSISDGHTIKYITRVQEF